MDWKRLLVELVARSDLETPFPAIELAQDHPAWLSGAEQLVATAVAARVLEIIAKRGGVKVGASAFSQLRRAATKGFDPSAKNLCDAEAYRVLAWLEDSENADRPVREPDIMELSISDLNSRRAVVEFAISQGYDLLLDVFADPPGVWRRLRGTPLGLDEPGPHEPEEDYALSILSESGQQHVRLNKIRWLMPVQGRTSSSSSGAPAPGDALAGEGDAQIIEFPGTPSSDFSS